MVQPLMALLGSTERQSGLTSASAAAVESRKAESAIVKRMSITLEWPMEINVEHVPTKYYGDKMTASGQIATLRKDKEIEAGRRARPESVAGSSRKRLGGAKRNLMSQNARARAVAPARSPPARPADRGSRGAGTRR